MKYIVICVVLFAALSLSAQTFGPYPAFCDLVPTGVNAPLYQYGNNIVLGSDGCAKITFVTSAVFLGNLGGQAGADTSCQQAANTAGLPGKYRAWLDTSSHLTQVPLPYVLVDNAQTITTLAIVAPNWVAISNGVLTIPINETELGTTAPGKAWAGQDSHGVPTGLDCVGWTSSLHSDGGGVGSPLATDGTWSNYGSRNCDVPQSLYCFQQ
jgi:hypothetical protein